MASNNINRVTLMKANNLRVLTKLKQCRRNIAGDQLPPVVFAPIALALLWLIGDADARPPQVYLALSLVSRLNASPDCC